MRFPVDRLAALGLLAFVAACGHSGGDRPLAAGQSATPPAPGGPAADYPMVLGAPFTIDGVTFTPADTLNFDHVGYASIGSDGGNAISLAHRTLPLPSYVEVTSLRTGKTILARAERRGPMSGDALIELSPGAAAQLGADGRTPVRVRRVNPPEPERALLRAGQRAPERMDTPMSLVSVLMRKLEPAPLAAAVAPAASPPVSPAAPGATAAAPADSSAKTAALQVVAKPEIKPASVATPRASTASTAKKPAVMPPTLKPLAPKPAAAAPAKPASSSGAKPSPGKAFVVQVGAFASGAHAAQAAKQVGGAVAPSGKFYRVRITGFATIGEAQAALAKAKGAGYSDARIQRAD